MVQLPRWIVFFQIFKTKSAFPFSGLKFLNIHQSQHEKCPYILTMRKNIQILFINLNYFLYFSFREKPKNHWDAMRLQAENLEEAAQSNYTSRVTSRITSVAPSLVASALQSRNASRTTSRAISRVPSRASMHSGSEN